MRSIALPRKALGWRLIAGLSISLLVAFAPPTLARTLTHRSIRVLASRLHDQAPNISTRVMVRALEAYAQVRKRHLTDKPIVTVVDYSLSSARKRFAVANVRTGKVLFYTYVAHGRGSGKKFATRFSNKPGTEASSLGVFLTGRTYTGKNGFSLRLKGLNPRFNGAAYERDIVVHSAWYVSSSFARKYGRMGRSWGCFALSKKVEAAIVDRIQGGTVLFSYYPDPQWLATSPFLKPGGQV